MTKSCQPKWKGIHFWRHSHMQLFIESENYRTASGNSKLTSLPVSFLYTEAKVSVLCSMLVCWVLSRCTLNRREPSSRILEESDFNYILNHFSRICVSVFVWNQPDPLANDLVGVHICSCADYQYFPTWSSCQQSRRGTRDRRGWRCAQPAGFATWTKRGLSWHPLTCNVYFACIFT